MPKKSKGKRSRKLPAPGPTALERKKNALVCSLAHYLQVDKHSIILSDNGKVRFIDEDVLDEDDEEEEDEAAQVNEKQDEGDKEKDTAATPDDNSTSPKDTTASTDDLALALPSLPPSRTTSRPTSRATSSHRTTPVQTTLDLETSVSEHSDHPHKHHHHHHKHHHHHHHHHTHSSSESESSESESGSSSDTDNEEGYDSEGLPNSPVHQRVPVRPAASRWNGNVTIQKHRKHRKRKKPRQQHRHPGHHKDRNNNNNNHEEKNQQLLSATAPAALNNPSNGQKDMTFLTGVSPSKTTKGVMNRLGDGMHGLRVEEHLVRLFFFFFPFLLFIYIYITALTQPSFLLVFVQLSCSYHRHLLKTTTRATQIHSRVEKTSYGDATHVRHFLNRFIH